MFLLFEFGQLGEIFSFLVEFVKLGKMCSLLVEFDKFVTLFSPFSLSLVNLEQFFSLLFEFVNLALFVYSFGHFKQHTLDKVLRQEMPAIGGSPLGLI